MPQSFLVLAVATTLAWVNGANDVSKGIATLVGSGVTDYRRAAAWGTGWTGVGGLLGAALSSAMVTTFGSGLVAPQTHASFGPALATLIGATAWVLIATRTGLPVSTTHAIVGSLVGVASVAYGASSVQWGALAGKVALPLLVSPVVALVAAAALTRATRGTAPVEQPECLCLEVTPVAAAVAGHPMADGSQAGARRRHRRGSLKNLLDDAPQQLEEALDARNAQPTLREQRVDRWPREVEAGQHALKAPLLLRAGQLGARSNADAQSCVHCVAQYPAVVRFERASDTHGVLAAHGVHKSPLRLGPVSQESKTLVALKVADAARSTAAVEIPRTRGEAPDRISELPGDQGAVPRLADVHCEVEAGRDHIDRCMADQELDAQLRMLGEHLTQARDQLGRSCGGGHRHPHRARQGLVVGAHVLLDTGEVLQDAANPGVDPASLVRDGHAPRRAVHQAHSEPLFEERHPLTDSVRRQPQHPRRRCEAAAIDSEHEGAQPREVVEHRFSHST